jgi:hypothetical protein
LESIEYYLRYLTASIPELDSYLLSSELFWPVAISPPAGTQAYPRLTLGSLLYAEKVGSAFRSDVSQQTSLRKIQIEIDRSRIKWRTAWQAKARKEWISRLRQWWNYLEEYRQHPDNQFSYYSMEVRWRVFVELLRTEIGEDQPEEEYKLLTGLDLFLESVFQHGGFIWDELLETAFPRQPYWYLYGRLKQEPMQ